MKEFYKKTQIIYSILLILLLSSYTFAQIKKVSNNYYLPNSKFISDDLNQVNDLFNKSAQNNADINFKTMVRDFTINSHEGEADADQNSPAIAIDGAGNYAITWIDYRNGLPNIYAQFYNNLDHPIGENILVSDDVLDWNSDPAIDCNSSGDFLISWAPVHSQIVAQRFTNNGSKIDSNFQIVYGYAVSEPSISVFENGSFAVCWVQRAYSGGSKNLYISIIGSSNSQIVEQLQINDIDGEGGSSFGWGNRIASDANGNMIVIWSEYTHSIHHIYIQRITNNGIKEGENLIVSDTSYAVDNYFPTVAATNDGNFIFSWKSDDAINYRIYHYDNIFITDHIKYSNQGWQNCWVASNQENVFLLSWLDPDPTVLKISTAGNVLAGPTVLKTELDTLDVYYTPVISDLVDNSFYIVYPENNYNDSDIYAQKYYSAFEYQWLAPQQIGRKNGSSWQIEPLVYFNDFGQSIVLWKDHRNGRYDLYGQVFDEDSKPVGSNIRINDDFPEPTKGYRFIENPAVCSFKDGTFVIAFNAGERTYDGLVYLQRVNSNGEKIDNNYFVSDEYDQQKIEVFVNKDNRLIVCWFDENSVYGIHKKVFTEDLRVVSGPVMYNTENSLRPFALSINENGNIFISFGFRYPQDGQIYGLVFDQSGDVLMDTIYFPNDNGYHGDSMDNLIDDNDNLIVTINNGYNITIFRKYYNLDEIFNNKYDAYYHGSYTPHVVHFENRKAIISSNDDQTLYGHFINDNTSDNHVFELYTYPQNTPYDMFSHSIDIFNNKLFFVYESSKNIDRGYDILGNIKEFTGFDFDSEKYRKPVNDDVLYPNYPNPFNAKTIIPYRVFSYFKIKIALYDVTGREVSVLTDKYHGKGYYEIELDSSTLSSGIYFVRMEAFHTFSRKLLLIK